MATEADARRRTVERYNRATRWFHAGVYLAVLLLLATGWWLAAGFEGRPSVLAWATGVPDALIHTTAGWVLTALAGAGAILGRRAVRTLLAESVRFRRAELRWFRTWPTATVTGRFTSHDGHFDPGQRVANLVLLTLLVVLLVSGAGLALAGGGPAFVWLLRLHRWATYLCTPVLAGHILIGAGVLPGYRGVWRAMHAGGRLRVVDAARVWPGWTRRVTGADRERR